MKVNFLKAIKIVKSDPADTWNGKTILQVPKNHGVNVGDSVKVVSPIYNGVFYCEYIYRRDATTDGLYFRNMIYQGDTTGTVEVTDPGSASPTSGTTTTTSAAGNSSSASASSSTSQAQQTISQAESSIKSWAKNWWFWAIVIVLGIFIIKKVKS